MYPVRQRELQNIPPEHFYIYERNFLHESHINFHVGIFDSFTIYSNNVLENVCVSFLEYLMVV